MRKAFLVLSAALALLIGASLSERASAMTLAAPAGAAAAAADTSLVDQVRYVCRRVWRCRAGFCGWRRVCWWRPGGYYPYYGYYRPYRYYRPYGYRWHRPWRWYW